MTGVLAHDDSRRLRSAIADVLRASSSNGTSATDSTRIALFRVLDVLESNSGVVVFPADIFVSTQQVTELLGVSRMTVVRLIDRGELAAEGGRVHRKIAAAEIERYRSGARGRRRAAMRELAQDFTDDLPADRVISTR
ncbi:MAG: helix-turn-helix domain-containing protein [Leucobacter sp.]